MKIAMVALVIAIAGSAIAGPATVPGRYIKELWTIEAQLPDGKKLNLLVSPTRDDTFISEESYSDKSFHGTVDLKFGDVVLNAVSAEIGQVLAKYSGPGNLKIDGFLGLSALRQIALGLDKDKSQWTVWKGGSVSETDTKAWLGNAKPWNQALSNDLQFDRGRPFLTWKQSADPLKVFLDFSDNWSYLPQSAASGNQVFKVREEPLFEGVNTTLSLSHATPAWLGSEWLLFGNVIPDTFVATSEAKLALEDLLSPKFILDIPGKKLWKSWSQDSQTIRLRGISRLIGLPFAVKNETLAIGDINLLPVSDSLRRADGAEVVSIGSLDSKDVLDRIIKAKNADWDFVCQLGASTSKTFTLTIKLNGKEIPITINRRT